MKNCNIELFELPKVDELPDRDSERLFDFTASPFADNPNFRLIGDLPYLNSSDIDESPLSIGYETLDRQTYDPSITYAHMAKSGIKWARLQSGWNRTEQEEGVYDFLWLDEIVDNLLKIGITPWISLSYGNRLYTKVKEYEDYIRDHKEEAIPPHIEQYVGEVPIYHGDKAIKGWENYLKAIVSHYGGKVSHWEIWNEPNAGGEYGGGFWKVRNTDKYSKMTPCERRKCFAKDYTELVEISSKAIKSIDPDAKIIAGAISNGHEQCEYIFSMAQNGIAKHADIISYHPYGLTPELGAKPRFDFIHDNVLDHTGKSLDIWQGEAGRTAGKPREEYSISATEYNQAKYLVRRYFTDISLGCKLSSYFMVCDMGGGYLPDGDFEFGVICRKDGKPRLSYYALQAMGFLFAGIKPANDLYIRFNKPDFRICSSNKDYQFVTGKFRRKGVPVFGIYYPEMPDINFNTVLTDIRLYTYENDTFSEPIVIDPIRRQVFRIEGIKSPDDNDGLSGIWWMNKFPVTDYPVFITDISILK